MPSYEDSVRIEKEQESRANFPWLYNAAGDYDPRFQDRPELEGLSIASPIGVGIHAFDQRYGELGCEQCQADPEYIEPTAPLTQDDLEKGYSSPANPKPTRPWIDPNLVASSADVDEFMDLQPAISTLKHMTQAEALTHQEQMFADALVIMKKKRFDYSGTVDPFKNLRDAAFVGVNPLQGVMVRIMDKFARIRSFIEEGTLKVNDESTRDTLIDVLNYTCILAAMIEEEA